VFESFFGGGYYGFVEVANSAVQLITSGNYNLDELAEDVADRYEIDDNTRTATRVGTEMFTFAVDILDGGGAPTGQFSSSLRNFQDAGYGLTSSVFLAAADVLGNALGSENWINVWEGRDRSGADLSGGQRTVEAVTGVVKYALAVITVLGAKASLGGGGAKVNPVKPRAGDPATAAPNRTVIGKTQDLDNLAPGENTLLKHLPDQGTPRANWRQNSSVLRQEIRKGRPIRDASLNADGTLRVDKPSSFLEAERNLLRNQGWTFDPSTGFWSPPQ
jgi:hypothetical protein